MIPIRNLVAILQTQYRRKYFLEDSAHRKKILKMPVPQSNRQSLDEASRWITQLETALLKRRSGFLLVMHARITPLSG